MPEKSLPLVQSIRSLASSHPANPAGARGFPGNGALLRSSGYSRRFLADRCRHKGRFSPCERHKQNKVIVRTWGRVRWLARSVLEGWSLLEAKTSLGNRVSMLAIILDLWQIACTPRVSPQERTLLRARVTANTVLRHWLRLFKVPNEVRGGICNPRLISCIGTSRDLSQGFSASPMRISTKAAFGCS